MLLLQPLAVAAQSPSHAFLRPLAVAQDASKGSSSPAQINSTNRPLSEAEKKELLGSVDDILAFASGDTGLAIHGRVGRRLVSRDEVTQYLRKQFNDNESAKRLERSELVLKKFGLLPREFDLRPFLLRLLAEQVAGFYDSKTKTVNLLNWVKPEDKKPVLAHELTHALQDQAVGLERWSDAGVHGVARTEREVTEHLRTDELETARSAVAEGQAMLIFTDYALRPSHRTLLDAPEILDRLLTANASGEEGSPVLASAPRVLQDSLLFPYTEGLAFEAALLRAGGKPQAFTDALARPPASSFEVMTPAAYLARQTAPVLRLPDIGSELADYAPYDVGVLGELDVRILAETYSRDADAKAIAATWDGGVYYAAQRRTRGGSKAPGTASLGLVYFSRWSDTEAAQRFAVLYREELSRKYRRVVPMIGDVREADASALWFDTEEGSVVVAVDGRSVFVAEGLAPELEARLRDEVRALNTDPDAPKPTTPDPVATAGETPAASVGQSRSLTSGLLQAMGAAHYTLLGRRPN